MYQTIRNEDIYSTRRPGTHPLSQRIKCACGCGTLIDSVNHYGRLKRYALGHSEKKRGPRKPESEKFNYKLQIYTYAGFVGKLNRLAAERGVSLSRLIRDLLEKGVEGQ